MGRLQAKRALVTGAGSNGIGKAIVNAFCREGAQVVAHYYADPIGPDEAARLSHGGGLVRQVQADFSDKRAARRVVDEAVECLGGLDIVVANAAMMQRIPFLEISDEQFQSVTDVNLVATFAYLQQAAKHMVSQGQSGRIIVISSVNQEAVVPHQSHYCASKGGLKQLARAMALELGKHDIGVNLIAPGATMTDMVRDKYEADPEWAAAVADRHPLGRVGQPADFEGAAVFLASAESAFITGATIVVDGGLTLSP